MQFDEEKIEQDVLALLYLTAFQQERNCSKPNTRRPRFESYKMD